jgi:hypothetical protein
VCVCVCVCEGGSSSPSQSARVLCYRQHASTRSPPPPPQPPPHPPPTTTATNHNHHPSPSQLASGEEQRKGQNALDFCRRASYTIERADHIELIVVQRDLVVRDDTLRTTILPQDLDVRVVWRDALRHLWWWLRRWKRAVIEKVRPLARNARCRHKTRASQER